jgi:hypothetical protein
MAKDTAGVREYRGVVNIGEATHIYTNANIYVSHAVIVPKAMGLSMVEDFPDQLELMDAGVVEQIITERCEGLPDDATADEREKRFLHKVFATIEPEDDETAKAIPPETEKKGGKKSTATGPVSQSGL